uniref:Uncharacterized protein n=1 Tax=Arundo donax TaxID=35708 RepID=A0A0A8YDU0_ARUDO
MKEVLAIPTWIKGMNGLICFERESPEI